MGQSEDGPLPACKASFVEFASKLERYFDFISIFVRVKPQWRQTIYGIIYLTFKVFISWLSPPTLTEHVQASSSYLLFLQEIKNLLDNITQFLPDYDQLHALIGKQPQSQDARAREHHAGLSSYLYTDLAQFLLNLQQMFRRASQGMCFLRTKFPHACTLVFPPVKCRRLFPRLG